jgi:hypothetical protein
MVAEAWRVRKKLQLLGLRQPRCRFPLGSLLPPARMLKNHASKATK